MHKAINKLLAITVIAIIAMATLFALYLYYPQLQSSSKKVLRIAVGIDPDTLDPHGQTTTLASNIMSFMVEPLFYYNEKGELIPWLAESYTISPDGQRVTVTLKRGIKFHDGYPLNSTAVKLSFDRIMNPKVKVPLRYSLEALNYTEIIDEYTIRFNLKYPYVAFVRALTSWYIISPTAYQKLGEEKIGQTPLDIGTGPLKFKEWVKGESLILTKFDGYWNGAVKFDDLIFKIVPEAQTREAMLLSGEVDIVYQPPPTDVSKLNTTAGIKVIVKPSTRTMTVNINTQRSPLNDVRVRQALNYAIDKKELVEKVLLNMAVVYDSPVYPTFFGYSSQRVYEYNPEIAKQLLAEAGYSNGFELTLMCPVGRYIFDKQVGEAIQSYLSKVGIRVKLYTPDWPTFVANLLMCNYTNAVWDLCYVGYGPTTPDADASLYGTFHSSQWAPGKFNTMFYKNERVDKLLDDARRELDENKRLQMYAEAQAIIWEECPWIFLYFQNFVLAHSDKVHGLVVYPYETFDIRWISIS